MQPDMLANKHNSTWINLNKIDLINKYVVSWKVVQSIQKNLTQYSSCLESLKDKSIVKNDQRLTKPTKIDIGSKLSVQPTASDPMIPQPLARYTSRCFPLPFCYELPE
uniref:Uncharacterized protein n=1 Tax=Arundo donax TaxID=35708 RepID=A0A0A9VBU8_ARUDO